MSLNNKIYNIFKFLDDFRNLGVEKAGAFYECDEYVLEIQVRKKLKLRLISSDENDNFYCQDQVKRLQS